MKFPSYKTFFITSASTATLAIFINSCGVWLAHSPRVSPLPDPASHIIYVAEPNNSSVSSSYATNILEFDASLTTGTTAPIATLTVDPNLNAHSACPVDSSGQLASILRSEFPSASRNPGLRRGSQRVVAAPGGYERFFTSVPSGALIGKVVVDSAGLIYIPVSYLSTILVYAANANGAAI